MCCPSSHQGRHYSFFRTHCPDFSSKVQDSSTGRIRSHCIYLPRNKARQSYEIFWLHCQVREISLQFGEHIHMPVAQYPNLFAHIRRPSSYRSQSAPFQLASTFQFFAMDFKARMPHRKHSLKVRWPGLYCSAGRSICPTRAWPQVQTVYSE